MKRREIKFVAGALDLVPERIETAAARGKRATAARRQRRGLPAKAATGSRRKPR